MMARMSFSDFLCALLVKLIVAPMAILLPLLLLGQISALQNSLDALSPQLEPSETESLKDNHLPAVFQQ